MTSSTSAVPPASAALESAIVVTRPEPGVAVVMMSRPAARNSLSLGMMEGLIAAFAKLSTDTGIKAIVLAAEGAAFSAGHDLKEMRAHRADADGGRGFYGLTMRTCSRLMQDIVACPKPVIAAVQATATAAGCQLVATCDLAVSADTARFCTPGVSIGLFCSTPMVALARNVPRKRAMEMLLLGEMISAADAAQYGLVNKVVPASEVLDAALDMARRIAARSPATVAIGKRAFYEQIEQPLAEAYDYAAGVMVHNMMLADAEEGIDAFIDKRPPRWKGC